jgi:hypothetical protein
MKSMWAYKVEETPSEDDVELFTQLGCPEVLKEPLSWVRDELVRYESFEMFTEVSVAYIVHDRVYIEPTLALRLSNGTVVMTERELEKHL